MKHPILRPDVKHVMATVLAQMTGYHRLLRHILPILLQPGVAGSDHRWSLK